MAVTYKQKCRLCRKNYVTVTRRQYNIVCYDCQKNELKGKVKDPKMKQLFDIPDEFYKENSFLRDIKIRCLNGIVLTEKQIEAFSKVVEEMRNKPKSEL